MVFGDALLGSVLVGAAGGAYPPAPCGSVADGAAADGAPDVAAGNGGAALEPLPIEYGGAMPLGGAGAVGPGREGTLRTGGGVEGEAAPPAPEENAPGETRPGATIGEPVRGSLDADGPAGVGLIVVRSFAGRAVEPLSAELP